MVIPMFLAEANAAESVESCGKGRPVALKTSIPPALNRHMAGCIPETRGDFNQFQKNWSSQLKTYTSVVYIYIYITVSISYLTT